MLLVGKVLETKEFQAAIAALTERINVFFDIPVTGSHGGAEDQKAGDTDTLVHLRRRFERCVAILQTSDDKSR